VPDEQEALLPDLWRLEDTRIIIRSSNDVGWVEVRQTRDEIFLKQLFVAPANQGQGISTSVAMRLLADWTGIVGSVALFVLKNSTAVRFYERLGFSIVRETPTKFVMRRGVESAAHAAA